MTKKKAFLITLGCKVNQFESAAFKSAMEDGGFDVIPRLADADVVIINTCAVTGRASAQSRQEIRRAARENPQADLIITGCHAQTAAEEIEQLEGVDQQRVRIIGNDLKEELVPLVLGADEINSTNGSADFKGMSEISRLSVKKFSGRTRAYLRVQDGCNSFCSYCIVPFARGRSRSLPLDEVIQQAGLYVEAGHLEIVITGIHVGQYGTDLKSGCDISSLVAALCNAFPMVRFRLSSIEPVEISLKLLTLMNELDNFMAHLHIPLQSGDDEILARMNRRYTTEQFKKCIRDCRNFVPEAAIGIDVMVGFPGESMHHFRNSEALLREVDCTYLHVFPYSIRPGTRAAEFPDQIARTQKRSRVELLRNLDVEKKELFHSRFLSARREVLIENERDHSGRLKGFTDNYIPVRMEGPDELMNRIVPVKLTALSGQYMTGDITGVR